jgi:glucarate dehydratase
MRKDIRITHARVTPIAFRDAPLLNASGIHEPWALRSIIELETSDGRLGIAETYGDAPMLLALEQARPLVTGLSPFDLNVVEQRVRASIKPGQGGGVQFELAPGSHTAKNAEKVISALEVAMLDLQGQLLGLPICDLLGGAVRDAVPYSAYLFYKYAEHVDKPYAPDAWGEAVTPAQLVKQAQAMVDQYGFKSIKLKGGVFAPAEEIAGIKALRKAFPTHPLRLDPNANWSLKTSIDAAHELDELLEYYEDPTPGLEGMAQLAGHCRSPLATNMVVTTMDEFRRNASLNAVKILLSDHHYWGGLRATASLARMCEVFGMGMSMHSNSTRERSRCRRIPAWALNLIRPNWLNCISNTWIAASATAMTSRKCASTSRSSPASARVFRSHSAPRRHHDATHDQHKGQRVVKAR